MTFEIFFFIFVIFAAIIVFKSIFRNRGSFPNNYEPQLVVDCKIIFKRVKYDRADTIYYATFQFSSGDRIELRLNGNHYGMIVEGDQGKLTFKGRQFIDFKREFREF